MPNDFAMKYVERMFQEAYPDFRFGWVIGRIPAENGEKPPLCLDVFNIPPQDHWPLLRKMRPVREKAREILGEKLFLVFHDPQATREHYPDFSRHTVQTEASRTSALNRLENLILQGSPHSPAVEFTGFTGSKLGLNVNIPTVKVNLRRETA